MDEDDFFNDDPFEDIVASFFNRSGIRKRGRNQRKDEEDNSELGFIETPDYIFLILEIPGYSQKEIAIIVKNNELHITAQKSSLANVKVYLVQKFEQELKIIRTIPSSANAKKMDYTYKNGVLEVAFEKK